MARRLVDVHPEAIAETREARLWYRERSPEVEERFRRALLRAVRSVRENPERWPADGDGIRSVPLWGFPFRLLYSLEGDDVLIVAVAHGKRRPGYWRPRLK